MVTLITTLASLTSRTSMGIIVVGGVVRNSTFYYNENWKFTKLSAISQREVYSVFRTYKMTSKGVVKVSELRRVS